jgi:hypothetical protein
MASAHRDWDVAGEVLCEPVEGDDANYAVRFHHSFL